MSRDAWFRFSRRQGLATASLGCLTGGCNPAKSAATSAKPSRTPRGAEAVLEEDPLGTLWPTLDPFLFCAYHDDAYPRGNGAMGPAGTLQGRNLGQDFEGRDGWRMYHGLQVPGFPQHPHRGFETITITRRGVIDHADSLGATARYGGGDVQWLTAGAGIVHAEMFPLLETQAPNPLELFQVWLNLPGAHKFAAPHFSMFWREAIPRHVAMDEQGRKTLVTVIAGSLEDARALRPPPNSWAAQPRSALAVWTISMPAHACFTLPAHDPGLNRALYVYRGGGLQLGLKAVPSAHRYVLRSDRAIDIVNGPRASEMLLLQGRPINEPVVKYGPFVMNTQAEIEQAFRDYRQTGFGGWPWPRTDPVHPAPRGRFAVHANGKRETAG